MTHNDNEAWIKLDSYTDKMKVPGGWIIRSSYHSSSGVSIHQIFINDPEHSWENNESGYYLPQYDRRG